MKHPLDTFDFRQMILDSPRQFVVGFKAAHDINVPGEFTSVMVSGMGGSALPGNLFRTYLADLARQGLLSGKRVAIYQNRFYRLPHESFDRCLNFICSYSGNTEETISSFEEALRHKLPCVGFSNGGAVEALCQRHHVPHVRLPFPTPGFQPRMGTGYFIGAMYQVLVNQKLAPDTTARIAVMAEGLERQLPQFEAAGKVLAEKLVGKTPVIYSSTEYKGVAMIWKIKMNENAKTPAFWNYFPELNHNEMVGYTHPQGAFVVVMLRDPDDHPQNRKRFALTAELLRQYGVSVEILDMSGTESFEKMFGSLLIADFASYYLALQYRVDPTPVDMVEQLKKTL